VIVRCILAQAYLSMQRSKDAEEQIVKAKEHLHELQDPSALAIFSIQRAIVQNASKPSEAATLKLRKIEAEMRATDQLQLALEAKLARLETLTGPSRKAELRAFTDEAKQHGYLLLARKANIAAGA
jgi:hypothetical protein